MGLARSLGLALAAALLSVSPVAARDGDASGLTLDGRAYTGNPRSVAVAGGIAYVGLDSGLEVWDTTFPNFSLLGSLYLPSPVHDIVVRGMRAYLACGESGLLVVDVSNPAAPALLGQLSTPDARGVSANATGTLAVVADAGAPPAGQGLFTVDTTTASSPVQLGFLPLANGGLDVAFLSGKAYVGLGSDTSLPLGLVIVDASTPATPSVLGTFSTGSPVHGVALDASNRAFLATGLPLVGALVIVNVATPAAPAQLGRASLADAGLGLVLDGSRAMIAASSLGLLMYDISNPATPTRLDSLVLGREAVAVGMEAGGNAWVASRSSSGTSALQEIDATGPPTRMSIRAQSDSYAEANGVALAGANALVLRRNELGVVDWAAGPPSVTARFAPLDADFSALSASAGLAAVAQGDCVRLVDVSAPPALSETGQACLAVGVAAGVALDGPLLYVATGRTLDVFDVSVPGSPALLTSWDPGLPQGVSAVAVDGARGFISGGAFVAALDLTQPDNPSVQDAITLVAGQQVNAVAVHGDIAAAMGETDAAIVYDLAASPWAEVARIPGGPAYSATMVDSVLFVSQGDAGVSVHDLATPAAPVFVASYDASSRAVGIDTDGAQVHAVTLDSQYWTFQCTACVAACGVNAVLDGPASLCEHELATLDATGSTTFGCPGGLSYQWNEEGAPIPGATNATYDLPGTLAAGLHRFSVDVSCTADPTCTDSSSLTVQVVTESYAAVDEASLRVQKQPATSDYLTSWTITSGTGDVNVHRDLDPSRVTASAIDASTVIATVTGTSYADTAEPGPGACFYIVAYGVGACSGGSVVP